ncbi:MAG: tryptophan synthase subunit alpha [Firmicutes bacterium]|nr:tryptophan synthase subunit alpha [Bacillota bacterium]
MNRIDKLFEEKRKTGGKTLVGFLTAGDPNPEKSIDNLKALITGCVDIIELGMPFSDPMADGPVIQQASIRALNSGTNADKVFELAAKIREKSQIPIVLFSYYNPIFTYGKEKFIQKAVESGADGLLVVDLPFEEMGELEPELTKAGLHLIKLIAPTTGTERMIEILKDARGFVYFVSMTGVTGSGGIDITSIKESVRKIKEITTVPVCVGFGVSTPDQAASLRNAADGIIVGSAFVKIIEAAGADEDVSGKITGFAKKLKKALAAG